MQTPYPERIASRETPVLRPGQAVALGKFNFTPEATGGPVGPLGDDTPRGPGDDAGGPVVTGTVEPPPPAAVPTPTPAPAPKPQTGPVRLPSTLISSKAIDKPAPPYPAIAKAAGVQGTVAVQIVIDEQGRVLSAKATGGHPLLLSAAVQAAYRARFTPTVLGGQAVKVTGSITYNFVLR
jgi:protein TonB